MNNLLRTATLALTALPLAAQPQDTPSEPPLHPARALALESWRAEHGGSWKLIPHAGSGYAEMLHGGAAAAPFQPAGEREWLALGRLFLDETAGLHGVDPATLLEERVVALELSRIGTTDKTSLRFRQEIDGVPVVDGVVNLLLDARGDLLSVHSTAVPAFRGPAPQPALGAAQARAAAAAAFERRVGLEPGRVGEAELVFLRVERGELRVPALAWQLELERELAGAVPEAWRYWIDAQTGELLEARSLVHHLDVSGTVVTNATPGVKPDTGANPPTQQVVPHVRVTSSAGTVVTGPDGSFVFPGVASPLDVTVEYVGTFNDVRNDAGADHVVTVTLQPDQPGTVLLNPSPGELITSQANAYLGVGQVRDWIRSIVPSDGTADFQAISNCNLASTCNAFFNGSSINFYRSGGGCVNTSYSTVVAHEYGHWLNVLYGTGNGSDGMGEGNADVFAMYLYDTPIVGEDFCGTGCHIRDGRNTRQFCGDCCGGCYGQVHADGEVWMGAAWKVRDNLNQTLGDAAGDLVADTLFLGWMNAYNQTQIRSIIETQWLTLDDDDGNIDNGTPNYADIDAGFRAQGFPGVDLALVLISNVTELSDTQDELGPYVVDATIVAGAAPPITEATLHYRVDGGAYAGVPMSNISGDQWQGAIPGQVSPAVVEYYVSATDSNANTGTSPEGGAAAPLEFSVGVLTVFLAHDFEAPTNEGWSVGAPGDTATTGIWERVDPVGTAAQPEDDTTAAPGVICWVTGQQPAGGSVGTNDVDGGATTLLSPVFDAAGLNGPRIRYWRWYSNDQGSDPGNDVFTVDVSNDGGQSWVPVEVVGPSGPGTTGGWIEHSFRIADLLIPTSSMRLRFVASDLNAGSIVEAALDDVRGTDLAPVGGTDCNGNGVPDDEEIANGTASDCDANGVPDECQADCDLDGTPDVCEPDCDADGLPDDCEVDCDANGTPDDCEVHVDCNGNGVPDVCESFPDCDGNGVPDECDPDCDGDGLPDACEADCDGSGVPDDCEDLADCDGNGVPDACETFDDCDGNGVPDACDPDCDEDGLPDACETDANGNGLPDDCEIVIAVASGELAVSGTVTGSYGDTQDQDGAVQSIREVETGGKPANRYSYLEHKWTFQVAPGSALTFYVDAWHSSSLDGDDFALAWSMDDASYTGFLTVTKTTQDGLYQTAALPTAIGGTLYVRVQDTDRTPGHRQLDTFFVDHMYVETEGAGGATPPPAPSGLEATALSPSEIQLAWSDNSGDEDGFRVERSLDQLTWSTVATTGPDATSHLDTGLAASTTYHYRVTAFNGAGDSAASNVATATTTGAGTDDALAEAEASVAGSISSGSYLDTHAGDGVSEVLREETTGGPPAQRQSLLDHRWSFQVAPGGAVTFYVRAHHAPSSDGDDFTFQWSTTDVEGDYVDMLTVTKTADDGSYQSFELPAGVSGTVFVRVVDTDRTPGGRTRDTLSVDHMYVRSE